MNSNGDRPDPKVVQALELYSGFTPDQIREFHDGVQHPSRLKTEPVGMTPPNARSWSVSDLRAAEFTDAPAAIPGIVLEGLNILGGRPKVGKSWMGLQEGYAVGSGGMFLNIKVDRGRVLFLALEDSPRRLKKRVEAMGIPNDSEIEFHTEWRPLHEGGLDDLLIQIESTIYRLVIIDTLSRAIPGVDQLDPTVIGPIMAQLQTMATRRGLAIQVIDHTRKSNGLNSDPIDDIIASTAKTGTADTIMALYKEQGKPGAILSGRGRDIEEVNLKLKFDVDFRCWQCEGDATEIRLTERRKEILDALAELKAAQLVNIAKMIGQPQSNTYTRLQDLCNAGKVRRYEKDGNIFYERQ